MKTGRVFLISLVVFFGMAVISALFLRPEFTIGYSYQEEPLNKTEMKLLPNEEYIYEYEINGRTSQAKFKIRKKSDCLEIITLKVNNQTIPCFDEYGNEEQGNNFSISTQQIPLFKPCMLAVQDEWKWKLNKTIELNGEESQIEKITLETVGSETIEGRNTFKVKTVSEDIIIYSWIDKQKRILIREESELYTIRLIGAPFPLELQEE